MSRFVPAANLDVVLDHATHDDRLKVAEHMAIDARHNVNPNTGHYAEEVQTFDDDRGVGVDAHDVAGHIIEWGSSRQSPQAPIRRAADAAGRFEER